MMEIVDGFGSFTWNRGSHIWNDMCACGMWDACVCVCVFEILVIADHVRYQFQITFH